MSSRDGYRADITKNCCEQCRMMQPTCDVCKARNAVIKKAMDCILWWYRTAEVNGEIDGIKALYEIEQILKS